jgi:hypothetical protein
MTSGLALFGGLFVLLGTAIQAVRASSGLGLPKNWDDVKAIGRNVSMDWEATSWALVTVGAALLAITGFMAAR